MFKRLTAALYLRRLSRSLTQIAAGIDQQNRLLARLADHVAPSDPPTERTVVSADTGVSHLDLHEAELAQAYAARTFHDTGHLPDDDELLIYLADEKTTDLHKRLIERDDDLSRLAESRR